jgi:hypothetical protein
MDNTKNFVKVDVSTGYDDAATEVVLVAGDGAKLPAAEFNLVWWNFTDYPDPADDPNVEIVRVTGISTDTLTITRAQEDTAATDKNISGKSYKMILGVTKKTIDDIDSTYEKVANKKTDLTDNSDTYYPSQKAVKTAVDAKATKASNETITGAWTFSEDITVSGNIDIDADSAYLFDGENGLKLSKNGEAEYYSTLVGAEAGNSGSALSTYQTAVGHNAGRSNTGASQTAIGRAAGYSNEGASQTAVGYLAGYLNEGASQIALGYAAGYSNEGASQIALGYAAGRSNTGASQIALGYAAGYSNEGNKVIGIGFEATRDNTADDVVAIGYQAGKSNTVANQFIVKQANINATPLIQGDFSTGDVNFDGDITAASYSDNTPAYEGNALEDIKKIKSVNGEIDHDSLPVFAQKTIKKPKYQDKKDSKGKAIKNKDGEIEQEYIETQETKGRDLGAMISILTKAVQELSDEVDKLKK